MCIRDRADGALLLAGHGQQRPQGDKAAFDLKVRVGKIVARLGQHRLAQRTGILQQAADRALGLGLADGGVGIRHRRVLDGTPQLGVELPCNRQRRFPAVVCRQGAAQYLAPEDTLVPFRRTGEFQRLPDGDLFLPSGNRCV